MVKAWAISRLIENPLAVASPVLLTSLTTAWPAPTTMSKVSLTESVPSLAVTLTETVPTSATAGVPEKVRVEASKLSQPGSAPSSDFAAV